MWDNFEIIKDEASSCVGICIGLGSSLEEEGYKDSTSKYAPLVREVLTDTQPRVVIEYGTLTYKVSNLN